MCEEKTVILKPKESISADFIQSPHDTDCSYRNKDGNQVKGYSENLTKSCDKTGLNLISGVAVKTADAADNGYPEQRVVQAGKTFCDSVKNILTDGAYHSESNQEFVLDREAQLFLNAIQGAKPGYVLELDEKEVLTEINLKTEVAVETVKLKKSEKWRIKIAFQYRYFTAKEIITCQLRKKIAAIPQEILNIRNNVDATIFKLGNHYSNYKTRYRSLIKYKM